MGKGFASIARTTRGSLYIQAVGKQPLARVITCVPVQHACLALAAAFPLAASMHMTTQPQHTEQIKRTIH